MNLKKHSFNSSSSSAIYTAMIDADSGAASCNCRGWTFKRPGKPRSCKHTKEMEAMYGFQPGIVTGKALSPKVSIPAGKAHAADAAPSAPAHKSKPPVTAEAFAVAQAEVERQVALVKGKRQITIEDDEPLPAAPASMTVPAAAIAAFALPAPPEPKAKSLEPGPEIKPMLASAMLAEQTIADFENDAWIMEEKFDGHRLTLTVAPDASIVGWSRPGHDRPAAPRPLPAPLIADAKHLPAGAYDGELYVPGGTSSDVVRLDKADELRLVLFDVTALSVLGAAGANLCDRPLSERRALLELAVSACPKGGRVHVAEQKPVSLATVQGIWAAKGEGAILKRRESIYRSGWRSPAWVKVKKVAADVLTLTGFAEGKNGPYSVMELRHDDGRTTTVKTLTNDLLRAIEKAPESYVGRCVVISYMGFTTSGQWRHGQFDHFAEEAA
jgi:ATP-dependent DNA ligase